MSEQNYQINISKKDSLLKRTKGGEDLYRILFNEYGIPFEKKDEKSYYKTFNPFYDDTSAGLSVYRDKNGLWKHKDYGSDDKGTDYGFDPFNLFAIHYNLHSDLFYHLLKRIDIDVTMNCDFGNQIIKKTINSKYKNYLKQNKRYKKASIIEATKYDLLETEKNSICTNYFMQYGIDISKFPNVKQIRGYRILDKDGKCINSTIFHKYDKNIHLAYDVGGGYYKIHKINPKKFWYVGKKDAEYTFFASESKHKDKEQKNELLILTGGEKDAMTLASKGYDAFCLGSETAIPSKRLMKELYNDRKNIVILYDIDDTGIRMAQKIKDEYGVLCRIANLKSIIPKDCRLNITDVSDYVKYKLDEQKLINYIDSFKIVEDENLETITIEDEKLYLPILRKEETKEIAEINNYEIKEKETTSKAIIEDIMDDEKVDNTDPIYKGIDSDIFNQLPDLLKDVCYPIKESHQKDLVLLATLVVLSNILKVKGTYFNKNVYPNLFLFITAKASAGKGVLHWVKIIGNIIHKHLLNQYLEQLKQYRSLSVEERLKTEEPKKQTFFIPGNASSASLMRQLSYNNGFGVILESEADAINAVLSKEWGNFSDIYRKDFENEPITMLRKDDKNSFEIETPRFSIVLTGTQKQLIDLIPTSENGLFSRFLFLEFPLIKKWSDVFENTINFNEHYKNIGERLLEHYKSANEFEMVYTKKQQISFNKNLSQYQERYEALLGDDIIASVRRMGSIHFRISMLLTALRNIDNHKLKKIECSDTDFKTSNLLIDFLMKNTKEIYGYLNKESSVNQKLHKKQTLLYESLRDNFIFDDLRNNAKELQIPYGTAESYLRTYLKCGIVERIKKGVYSKIKF